MAFMDTSPKTEAETSRERRRRVGRECADRLVQARIAANMTEAEAAKAVGAPRSTWQEWEAGVIPDAVRGGLIEDALGVPRGSIYRDGEVLPHAAANVGEREDARPDVAATDGPRVVRDGFSQVEG